MSAESEIYRKGRNEGMRRILVPAFSSPTQAELGWGTLGVWLWSFWVGALHRVGNCRSFGFASG
jgi:hypothetical protein